MAELEQGGAEGRLCMNHIEAGVGRALLVEEEQTHTGFENLVHYQ